MTEPDHQRDFTDSPMLLEEALDGTFCDLLMLSDTRDTLTQQMTDRLCNPN